MHFYSRDKRNTFDARPISSSRCDTLQFLRVTNFRQKLNTKSNPWFKGEMIMPRETGKFHDQIVLFESNLLIICGINFFLTYGYTQEIKN